MTKAEKLEMYRNKRNFIKDLSKAFENLGSGSSVDSIDYEVYAKDVDPETTYYEEYVIVNFYGGGKSVRTVSGNSNFANFTVLGRLIDGGYYDEIFHYESLKGSEYKLLNLDNTETLDRLLSKPLTHISNVHNCFEHCRTIKDVEKVIDRIPSMFGTFTVYHEEGSESFTVDNDYEENGDFQSERITFDFCD